MKSTKISKNALIETTTLGWDDHGFLSFWLHLDYGGSGQGFGGYSLGTHEVPDSVGYAFEAVSKILDIVGVEKWEDLKGKYVRVVHEDGLISEIGHIIEDKWWNPKESFKKIEEESMI